MNDQQLRIGIDKAKELRVKRLDEFDRKVNNVKEARDWWFRATPHDVMVLIEQEELETEQRDAWQEKEAVKMRDNLRMTESRAKQEGAQRALAWVTVGGLVAVAIFDLFSITNKAIGIYLCCVTLAFYSSIL